MWVSAIVPTPIINPPQVTTDMKNLILSAVFASTLAATGAYAQTETTATTTSTTTVAAPDKKEQAKEEKARNKEDKLREKADKIENKEADRNKVQSPVAETQTTRTTSTAQSVGTVEEYTPGESIVVRTEAAEPVPLPPEQGSGLRQRCRSGGRGEHDPQERPRTLSLRPGRR